MGKIDKSWLWHRIMGHMSSKSLVKVSKNEAVRDVQRSENLHILFVGVVNMGIRQK